MARIFRKNLLSAFLSLALVSALATSLKPALAAAGDENFVDRKSYVINNCPFIELSGFEFKNSFGESHFRLLTNLAWKNTGQTAITAFEVVIVMYDPFNRPIAHGGIWLIPGTNSADWSPLTPGKSSKDGLIAYGTEYAYTGFSYVRAARLADGSVWNFDEQKVIGEIRSRLPAIKDFSNVNPKPAKDDKS